MRPHPSQRDPENVLPYLPILTGRPAAFCHEIQQEILD
jgi:hypothetical protein